MWRLPRDGTGYKKPDLGTGKLSRDRTRFVWDRVVGPMYNKFMYGDFGVGFMYVKEVEGKWVEVGHGVEGALKAVVPAACRGGENVNLNLSLAMWRSSWNGVRRALRFLDTPEKILSYYADLVGMPAGWLHELLDVPLCMAVPFFSKVKVAMHSNTDVLPLEWRYYVDIQTMAGYPDPKLREMADDPVLWLSSPVVSQYSKEWWEDMFRKTFSFSVKKTPISLLTLEEFALARWLWVTPGSSTFSELLLGDKVVRTKLGAAVSLTDEQILGHVRAVRDPPREEEIGVFMKPDEKGYKRRLIANVPLGGYIVAAYIRYVITQYTGDSPSFSKLSVSLDDQIDVVELLRDGRLAMPLDESGFEYHVSRESWLGFFAFAKPLVGDAISYLEDYFDKAHWYWEDQRGRWVSGMPSGLALTSFLNSWMNFIKQTAMLNGDLNWAAGDDVLVFPHEPTNLTAVAAKYAEFGSEVNATKNWLSYTVAEYLKVLYYGGGSTGYPARLYSSLIWGLDVRFSRPDVRLGELAELFKQFYDRVGVPMDVNTVSADLSRAMSQKLSGFSAAEAKLWLHSPKLHGGFGRLPNVMYSFTWDVVVVRKDVYVNARIRMPSVPVYGPADRKNYKFERKIVAPGKRSDSYRLGPPLRMRPVTNVAEWEARLNGEDMDVKGPFARMALDPIPLPVMDFVSTANMSALAKRDGYNVYPNLSGSWSAIGDRLLNASWALANAAVCWQRRWGLELWA